VEGALEGGMACFIGTTPDHKMYDALEREVGLKLFSNHCYKLVGCARRGGERYVTVKNPHNKSQQVAGPRATGAGGRAAGNAKASPRPAPTRDPTRPGPPGAVKRP
jgi:hypothetical protein